MRARDRDGEHESGAANERKRAARVDQSQPLIPAQAGLQKCLLRVCDLGPRFRGNERDEHRGAPTLSSAHARGDLTDALSGGGQPGSAVPGQMARLRRAAGRNLRVAVLRGKAKASRERKTRA